MKKYRISPHYIFILTLAIVMFLIPCCLICVIAWQTDDRHGLLIGIIAVAFSGIVGVLYLLLFDFPCGTFSFDNDGFRMRIGMKRYYHKWSDIQDVGIIKTKIGNSSNFYICYFSGRTLTIEDKRRFFTKTRKNRKDIGFFQYNHERVIEIANYLPEHLKMELVFDERVLGLV